jgi:hypothetical protein
VASFVTRSFYGEQPLKDPELLQDGYAQSTNNLRVHHSNLQAWNAPSAIYTPVAIGGTIQTIYRWGMESTVDTATWFCWTTDVDVVRAPIADDTTERTYFTGSGVPKMTYSPLGTSGSGPFPTATYTLGIPTPVVTGSTVTVSGTATNPSTDPINYVAYVVTYVSALGEEGAPSAPLNNGVVEAVQPGQNLSLSNLPVAPTGNFNIATLRLYRTNTGTSSTAYQKVADITIGTTTYADTASNTQLGEVVATNGWNMPPSNGQGMCMGPSGIAVMFAGRTVYPSVAYALYAYPDAYQESVDVDIVGIGVFDQSWAILTKGNPYVLQGTDPSQLTMYPIRTMAACASKRSIVSMLDGVLYCGFDGVWLISDNGIQNMTEDLFSRDIWQQYNPSSMMGKYYDGRYHVFWQNTANSTQGSMIFDFTRDIPYVTHSDQWATAGYYDQQFGNLYLCQSGVINKWDGGSSLTWQWQSKDYRSPWFADIGYGKIDATAYPVSFTYNWIDGKNTSHSWTTSVTSNMPFRIPPNQSRILSITLSGSATTVRTVAVAETGDEIANA